MPQPAGAIQVLDICQPAHEFHVAFQEVIAGQFFPSDPGDRGELKITSLPEEFRHLKKYQPRETSGCVMKIVASDLGANPRLDPQFLAQLARQGRVQFLPGLNLASGELPFERVTPPRLALPNQDETVPLDHRRDHFHHLRIRHSAIIETRMHSERLLDHFQNPRNPGELPPPALKVDVTNPACGDMLRLSARFLDGRVAEARFLTRGCTAAIAASSALTEWMTGKDRAQLAALSPAVIEEAVGGLEPASKHAAVLCIDALRRLLSHIDESQVSDNRPQ
jgi:nitrogen fixation NifU-like protein